MTGRQRARLCGIHLEGPFISKEKKGAQNPAYIMEPDVAMFHRLQEAAHGLVRLITIAPETAGAMDFIDALHDQVHISLGHTTSDYDTASEAFHLRQQCTAPPTTRRSPLVWRSCTAASRRGRTGTV